jgi:hypothetical protein
MKTEFVICATLIILTVSCKKSNDQINTPPVTDTVKPPVINIDTSTLLKSDQEYSYTGTVIVDSELKQWTFDDHRRITQMTYAFVNSNDTTRYTYLNDRYIATFDGYTKGSLRNISNTVYYLGPENRIDSILISTTGYGIEAGTNPNYATYYYYNQENQDTLEMHFSGSQGARSLGDSINYFYTGVNLDSATAWFIDPVSGISVSHDIDYYSEGNLTSEFSYTNGILDGRSNITYTNIPTGGLYIADTTPSGWPPISYRRPYLMSENTGDSPPLINTQTYSYTYELDAANRVKTMIESTNGVVYQKHVFTYY